MAKGVQHPTVRHVGILKHLGRYLKAHPRLVQVFRHQDQARVLHAWGDANHAGCIRTRKSTSGGSVMLGHHSVTHWRRGQAVVALSSGEAEFYNAVTFTAESIALQWAKIGI